jgi:hypothetical protein
MSRNSPFARRVENERFRTPIKVLLRIRSNRNPPPCTDLRRFAETSTQITPPPAPQNRRNDEQNVPAFARQSEELSAPFRPASPAEKNRHANWTLSTRETPRTDDPLHIVFQRRNRPTDHKIQSAALDAPSSRYISVP